MARLMESFMLKCCFSSVSHQLIVDKESQRLVAYLEYDSVTFSKILL